MSHAIGEVIHSKKVVGYFEYNGTCDIALNRIFQDRESLWEVHWRTEHANNAKCVCGQPPVDVTLYSEYGGGFHWDAKACLTCAAIVDGRDPWREVPVKGGFGFAAIDCDIIGPTDGHPLR